MTFRSLDLYDIDPNWDKGVSPRWRQGAALGSVGGMTVPVVEVFVHHTVSADTGDVVKDVSGPCDTDQRNFGKVSYSWNIHESTNSVVEVEGTHRGAHTINNAHESLNGIAFGFGVIGNFHPSALVPTPRRPSDFLIALIAEAIVEKTVETGLAVPDVKVLGHRDAPYATACCGDWLYERLPDIRRLVANPPPPLTIQETETMWAFLYDNDIDTFKVEDDGSLITRYYKGLKWHKLLLGGGCNPAIPPVVVRDFDGTKGRLDVFAYAAGPGVQHAWYIPGEPAWHFEHLDESEA